MKKVAVFLVVFTTVVVGLVLGVLKWREARALDQYIYPDSQKVLALGVDQLFIDNLSDFISFDSKESKDTLSTNKLVSDFIFKGGVQIPSNLYLFALKESCDSFFGILKVKDFDKCFSYFADKQVKDISFMDKEKSLVYVEVNKYLQIAFNKDHLIYEIKANPIKDNKDIVGLITQSDSWTKVKSNKALDLQMGDNHILFWQKDKQLLFKGHYKKDKLFLKGTYNLLSSYKAKVSSPLKGQDPDKGAFFYSTLDLGQLPLVQNTLQKLQVIQPIDAHRVTSVVFTIDKQTVLQEQTQVVYDYDADFNPIELEKVTPMQVPLISLSLSFDNSQGDTLLPFKDKVAYFYDFYGHNQGSSILYSTLKQNTTVEYPSLQEFKDYPLYLWVDTQKLPLDLQRYLKQVLGQKSLQLELKTALESEKTLSFELLVDFVKDKV